MFEPCHEVSLPGESRLLEQKSVDCKRVVGVESLPLRHRQLRYILSIIISENTPLIYSGMKYSPYWDNFNFPL